MSAPLPVKPWYREVWPWLLMLPPLASVAGGVTMVYLAVGTPEALVVDDYSRIEEIARERYGAERHALELGVAAHVTLEPARGEGVAVRVELAGASAPDELVLTLRHAAHAAADREIVLSRSDGVYLGATVLAVGRYELDLRPGDSRWLVSGTLPGAAATASLAAAGSETGR
jgi:hypothetical protein